MPVSQLTRAEQVFRRWMLISAWMYAVSGLFFLVAGPHMAWVFNDLGDRLTFALGVVLPAYPLPADDREGAFWLVLSLSMMAMITYICRAAYLDLRRNAGLVPLLLLSKFCSSAIYLGFFLATGQLAHLVGTLTDGPLFLVTLALWFPASRGDRFLDRTEEEIYLAAGETLAPRGGAFEAGYADFREESLKDAQRLFAALSPVALAVFRMMLRFVDLLPIFIIRKPRTFRRLKPEERLAFLNRLEHSPRTAVRMTFFAIKLDVLLPLFNRPEMERVTGWDKPREASS